MRALLNCCLSVVFSIKKGRNIHSTEAGRILINALPDVATQPDMTAHWESQLDGISRKQASYQQFMQTSHSFCLNYCITLIFPLYVS